MANAMPSSNELQSLSLACDRLWHLDKNRLEPGVHYELNLQNGKSMWQQGDVASEPLFKFVDKSVFERPTFHLFYQLLDNYERGVGIRETVTAQELGENNAFLNAILDTAPMRYAYNWLVKNKKFTGDSSAFKKKLDEIWFGMYRRQTQNDSSGFEHVFLGEEKDGKICGCHNWIQIYNEERAGRLNYLGYIKPKQRGHCITTPHNHEQLISLQFKWEKEIKPVSTSLIGVSPEFEMALYTLCFLNGKEDNIVQLGPYRCNIKCYTFGHGHNVKIGSAFPDTVPMTEEQAAVKIQAAARGVITRHQQEHHHHHGGRGQQQHQHVQHQHSQHQHVQHQHSQHQHVQHQHSQHQHVQHQHSQHQHVQHQHSQHVQHQHVQHQHSHHQHQPQPQRGAAPQQPGGRNPPPPPASAEGAWAKPHKW